MTDVDNLVVGAADLRDGTSTELLGDLIKSFDLSLGLDLVDGVSVSGVSDTVTVNCECAVTGGCSNIDIAVVVVVVGQIPVATKLLVKVNMIE